MRADSAWLKRNLGFDPIESPPPQATYAFAKAGEHSPEDLQREIIDFDSEAPEGKEFLAFTTATGLSRFSPIPWPKNLAPVTSKSLGRKGSDPLPRADALVVTWTVDEGHALSRVLTPGKDSHNDYLAYTHNYARISRKMRNGSPAKEAKALGAYWTTKIGNRSVVVFKSDSHMSQDGPQLPNIDVWQQIITEVRPKLVITTGTSGGIGSACEVGDVVVSPVVRFDCKSKFKKEPFGTAHYISKAANQAYFAKAKLLFKANAGQLPKTNTRPPRIELVPPRENALSRSVVTTDFFGFDTPTIITVFGGLAPYRRWATRYWGLSRAGWERARLHGSACATYPIRRSRPRVRFASRPSGQPPFTRASVAGAPSAAPSSAGR